MILLATGAAGPPPTRPPSRAAVAEACLDLATQMAGDAEGHTKVVTVEVTGALSDDEARAGARKVAESQLVKCSLVRPGPLLGPRGQRARHAPASPSTPTSCQRRATATSSWPRAA